MGSWPRTHAWRGAPPDRSVASWTPDASWEEVYSRDLSDGVDHDFLTDGSTVDIDGITWTAENNDASGAVAFEFADGVGLQIEPEEDTVWSPPTSTAPRVQVDLASLMTDYDVYDRLLLQFRVAAASLSEAGQTYGMVCGSEDHANDGYDGGIGATFASSNVQLRTFMAWGGAFSTYDVQTSQPSIMGVEWCGPSFSTAYDTLDRWPRPGQMTTASPGYKANNSAPRTGQWPWSQATVCMRIWAERPSGVAAFTATVAGLRVLRQRW